MCRRRRCSIWLSADVPTERSTPAGSTSPTAWSHPDRLLQAAQALRPPDVASTMVLGARTLDHLDLAGDEVVGWRAGTHWGVGDPAMDVAWMAAAIAATCGPPFVVAFAETYGDAAPGPLRSEFWITLGQLL